VSSTSRFLQGKCLRDLGESQLIGEIRRWLGAANPPPPHGIGDDCAILPPRRAGALLATIDPVIRGRHFTPEDAPARVAAKLLNRNLSDIAAMGGSPSAAVIAVAAPADLPVVWLRDFYRGLSRCALRHGLFVVGGDCTQTDGFLGAFLTLLGDAPPRPLTRSGAQPGDLVYVTGTLGGSILGRHLRFTPRLPEGAWLARRRSVHAAIDLSDGFAKDAAALVPAGTHMLVDSLALPASPAARRLAARENRSLLDCVLNDGEDYELLFTVASAAASRLERDWRRRFSTRLTRVGEIREGRDRAGPLIFSPPLPDGTPLSGYEHYR